MRTILTRYRVPDGRRRRPRRTLGREWVTVEVLTNRATVVMAAKIWSGYFVWEWLVERGRVSPWPEGWSYEEVKTMKRRGKQTADQVVAAQANAESKMLGSLPHVIEHQTSRQYDDGTARTPGRIMWDTIGSMHRLVAKEPDARMQLVVIMMSLDDAWLQLELLLGVDEAPWEPDPFAREVGPRKGKK